MLISILVILYDSSTAQSSTLQSILKAKKNSADKLHLSIWNNGPALLTEKDISDYTEQAGMEGIEVEIYQDVRNIALSKIYNFVIDKGHFDFFVPLDQDSVLNPDFFLTLTKHQGLDLILPLIYNSNGVVRFPYYEKQGVITTEGPVRISNLTSINSGMAISSRLVGLFKQYGLSVFDEHFAFYGVDTAFFLNLRDIYKKYSDITCGCYGYINHSLSMDEEEDGKTSYKRGIEHLYFSILYRLHYKKKSKLSIVFNVINKIFEGRVRDLESFNNVIRCILTQNHPRSSLNIEYQDK